jgi:hypothetical protein
MKASEVNKEIIGKRCRCVFTAITVTGVVEEVMFDRHTANVKMRFDEPVRWGDDIHNHTWPHARLSDDFGSLRYLEIIYYGRTDP